MHDIHILYNMFLPIYSCLFTHKPKLRYKYAHKETMVRKVLILTLILALSLTSLTSVWASRAQKVRENHNFIFSFLISVSVLLQEKIGGKLFLTIYIYIYIYTDIRAICRYMTSIND